VTIYDYGEFEGQPYLAMEYIEGESLADLIARRAPLSLADKLQLIDEVCAGMACVQRADLVHRDLKPDNIMVDGEYGPVKILDFGIARSLETGLSRFTQGIGTPCYMSPEQVTSGRVDQRSDIFAIGSVFYELLTYQRAFDGDTHIAIINKIAREEPVSITTLCPGLDPKIEPIVKRALSKEPTARYPNVQSFRADLAKLGAGPSGSQGSLKFSTHGVVALVTAAILLAVVGAGEWWMTLRAPASPISSSNSEATAPSPPLQSPTQTNPTVTNHKPDSETNPASSRQAERFGENVRVTDPVTVSGLTRIPGSGSSYRVMPAGSGLYFERMAWSPDGTHVVAGFDDGAARVYDVRTGREIGEPRQHHAKVMAVAWSPDSTRVATGSLDQTARVWDVRTGREIGAPLQHQLGVRAVAWSPDGTRVATGSVDRTARVWDARTGEPIGAPLQHQAPVDVVAWSPDGTLVATGSADKTARMWNARTGDAIGAPLQHQAPVNVLAWSPDGTRVATGSGDGTARVWDARTGEEIGAALQHEREVFAVAWSRDGTRLATGSVDKTARVWDARTGKAVGPPLQLQSIVNAVAWNRDGTRVVTACFDKTLQAWDARTGEPVGPPLLHEYTVTAVAWSRDGTRVVTGSADRMTRMYDPRTGQTVGRGAAATSRQPQ
jgi:WD40 repeat protein